MSEEWIPHKTTLLNAYNNLFSSKNLDSEFRNFLTKFEKKVTQLKENQTKGTQNTNIQCDSNGIPSGPYNRFYSIDIKLDKNVINKSLLRQIPSIAVEQFEYIIDLYFKFRNTRRFKKFKTLKKNQASLPIALSKEEILETIEKNQIVIIAGDTGCGKSTQLPQYLIEAGYEKIACTQPRRIACTALARRVAFEALKQFESQIAYQTRFDKSKTSSTKMLFLTEGVLLRQMASDVDLALYNVIILDEVHERNTSGDLLVTLLRSLCYRRQDLKLILMSATINIDLFSEYFPDAPLIRVPGRLYPIDLKYMPPLIRDIDAGKKSVKIDAGPYVNILQIIDKKYSIKERGDVLVFLNGISEISIVADALKEYAEASKKWIILILHSTLSVEEQNKVFDLAPAGIRKCILSTNIAETSVTIDEIRFVIDSGKENLMKYDSTSRTHRLIESWISKASADQRKGRAGRTGPGQCFRLYSNEEFDKMEDFTLSEIKRVSLDSLVMQILDMNLQIDVRDFPFLEKPDPQALNETLESLISHGVVNANNEKELTSLGLILAKLPVDVPISKMLICACVLDQVDVVLTIAAGLSVQSPFTNRSYRDMDCIQNRQHLISDMGDPFTLIKVFREWLYLRFQGEDTRKWTRQCGIEEARLYEIVKLRRQLREILEASDLIPKRESKEWAALGSRERRIKVGNKHKLQELKKRVGYEQKRSKILKEGQHFDTIMDEKVELSDDTKKFKNTNPNDDINSLEFSLITDERSMQRELTTHKLNDTTATIIKMIIALGLYPQYAIIEASNNFRVGHDQFAHSISRPFLVIHPNSALGQIPEALKVDTNRDGKSAFHQFLFFGLLLETSKSYLCNTSRIQSTFLLITARNIVQQSDLILCCDEFVVFTFIKESDCSALLKIVCEIRQLFLFSIESKLNSDDYGSYRDLERKIVKFSKLEYPFSVRRLTKPSISMKFGIFLKNGEPHPLYGNNDNAEIYFKTEDDIEKDKLIDEELNDKKIDDFKSRGREYFCEKCQETMWFENNVEIIKHNKNH